MSEENAIGKYRYLNPKKKNLLDRGKDRNKKDLKDGFIYVQSDIIRGTIKLDRKRKYYRITNGKTYVIRQLRGFGSSSVFIKTNVSEGEKKSHSIKEDEIKPVTMNYLNEVELKVTDEQIIEIQDTKPFDILRYYYRHPSRDIRFAAFALLIGFIMGLLSIGLSVWGVVCGCKNLI